MPFGKGYASTFFMPRRMFSRHIPLLNSVNESRLSPHSLPPQSAKHGSLAHAGVFSRNFSYAEKAGKARTHLRPSLQNTKALLTRAIFRVTFHVLV